MTRPGGMRASAYETEQRMLHADGSYRWVLSRGVVAYDAEGQPYRLLGADIDITELKQLEEALRRSEEKYRQLVEDIGETIYTVAHDGERSWLSASKARSSMRRSAKRRTYLVRSPAWAVS